MICFLLLKFIAFHSTLDKFIIVYGKCSLILENSFSYSAKYENILMRNVLLFALFFDSNIEWKV
jgi:hypothetical protein